MSKRSKVIDDLATHAWDKIEQAIDDAEGLLDDSVECSGLNQRLLAAMLMRATSKVAFAYMETTGRRAPSFSFIFEPLIKEMRETLVPKMEEEIARASSEKKRRK